MIPKEKAEQLIKKYLDIDWWITENYDMEDWLCDYTPKEAKEFALIAVNEILETTKVNWATQRKLPNGEWRLWKGVTYKKYWLEVKQEIEKL